MGSAVVPLKKGSRKHETLKKALEVFKNEPRVPWNRLISVFISCNLSESYAERLVIELRDMGIIRKVDNKLYEVDVEALERSIK